jgi:hypothetical protein
LYATRRLVSLNNFVMALVWLPKYVNVTHFCFCVVLDVLFVISSYIKIIQFVINLGFYSILDVGVYGIKVG